MATAEPQRHSLSRSARLSAVAVALVLAAACSTTEQPAYEERAVDDLYNEAKDTLEAGNYFQAAPLFEEVERQHPYSPWARKAQVMAAYAYYEADMYDEAIAAIDRYVGLHPAAPDVPYALYLKGISYYEQMSDVGRDQRMTEHAKEAFEELINRFPTSEYSRDARLKLDLTVDHLAGREMTVGRFYLQKGHYLAAINRFRRVIDDYQTTTHVPEALHRLAEAYTALGLDNEARKMAAILGHNFPGSEWYIDSYQLVENEQIRPQREAWYKFW